MEYLSQLSSDAAKNGLDNEQISFYHNSSDKHKELAHAMYWANEYEKELSIHFLHQLMRFCDIVLYGKGLDEVNQRVPVFSFNIKNVNTDELGHALNRLEIEARTGDYFAINLMKRLAPDFDGSGLRISLIHYNTFEEIDYFFESLSKVLTQK